MRSHAIFRRKLRHRLLQIAEARRRAGPDRPSGADLKVIARCESLADSALVLDSRLCTILDRLRADPASARRFAAVWTALPEAFATTLWPNDAAALVVWMIRQAAPDGASSRRTRSVAKACARTSQNHTRMPGSIYADLSGGLAVVAPVLAVWNVSVGLQQRHDLGVAAQQPGTEARMVAVPPAGVRGLSPGAPATIAFTPTPGAPECRIQADLGSRTPVGSHIVVVPDGSGCTTPLVPATIGDPIASFGLAAACAAAGVLALKTWCRLRVRADRAPASRPAGSMRLAS